VKNYRKELWFNIPGRRGLVNITPKVGDALHESGIPTDKYKHNLTMEDNADAHLKRSIMGREVVVAITEGRLDFGTWEQIFYYEFDGRRRKHVLVKIIGE